jgi:hypothetical protein
MVCSGAETRNFAGHVQGVGMPSRTTSHLDTQAYTEIREDGHPVIVLAGRDITDILKTEGLNTPAQLQQYLNEKHPPR